MPWSWKRSTVEKRLVVSWLGGTLAYVLACGNTVEGYTVLESAVKRNCAVDLKELLSELKASNLDGLNASVVLYPSQYQLLQIESPVVPADELRAAVRYQIRDMLDISIEDVRLDLMQVGNGQQKAAAQLFVVATPTAVIRNVLTLCEAMRWKVSVIDIHEMAQRNLQTALAVSDNNTAQAFPALVWVNRSQAILTISADGELFNTRRFDFSQESSAGFWDVNTDLSIAKDSLGRSELIDYALGYSESGALPKSQNDITSEYVTPLTPVDNTWNNDQLQRFLMELRRSFDLWERIWPNMPLGPLLLHAGHKSEDLAAWLAPRLERKLQLVDTKLIFPDFKVQASDEEICLPLLGLLLRNENRVP